jgi:sarcosine oxidase, subunit alpha
MRAARGPAERIDRERRLRFSFDGRPVTALEGDTIGSALFAAGRRTLSRSFKYHRPRGLLCCSGQCANCLVAVDGAPGVRACTEPVREGMRVEHMNAWPSLDRDAMAAVDRVGRPFTPPGFYYKTFIRPRRMWPLYERILRRAAGLGRLAERQDERTLRSDYRRRHADVLVIGGGAAGLAAATRAAELGADTVLVDEDRELGGRLLVEGGHERARELAAGARDAGVEVLAPAAALGYLDGLVPVWEGSTLHQIRARRVIVAAGTIEQPLVFPGNDLPGVMLSSGALRLLRLYGLPPGRRAVVASASERGLEAAAALRAAGVEVAAVADLRTGARVIRASGRRHLQKVTLAGVEGERSIDCDLLVVSGADLPATSLLLQAGARAEYDSLGGRFVADGLPAGLLSAGSIAGLGDPVLAELSGSVVGGRAAHELGFGDERDHERSAQHAAALAGRDGRGGAPLPHLSADSRDGRSFVCPCEDVTAKDIEHAAAEGYDSIELCKRYTTVTMGPCQGRMCGLAVAHVLAEATGTAPAEVGTTVARPPWSSVPLGVLAGRPFEPAKRSAIHERHRELGANVLWAGDWRRPYDYGDPHAEALAVHEAAGLIDLSPLGKLLVQGPEAGAFLDRLYPNRLSNLKPGRVRYGVLNSDAGRILDDGTVSRLDDDAFYVTTTSSGAGAVEEWFAWWLAEWRMDVRLTDLTQVLCAVNLAGPRSREILAGLAPELDCTPEGFGYLDARQGHVAGVPCLIARIGFVGELGYEIHFPAAHGTYLWDTLVAAGRRQGIRPFGLEPQRLLRLQKLHLIVGQDTDSESSPYEAAMPWIVKLDKEDDFVGRWALERRAEREPEIALAGFRTANGHVPAEGAAVVVDGRPAGRVTSARFSPRLGAVIGMASMPAALASDGATVTIVEDGAETTAEVTTRPFYDPDGERQRA